MKSILVYCGARSDVPDVYKNAARDLGYLLVERNLRLVFGGGSTGLMGVIANAVMEKGGEAIGVMPKALVDREMAHMGLTKLHIVDDMHKRKAMMMDFADAIIALPGGIGTMEEWFEAITWFFLKYHGKPVGLLNTAGIYDPLVEQLRRMHQEGFLIDAWYRQVLIASNAASLLDELAARAQ